MHIFGELVNIVGKLVHIFGTLVHIFAWKLVSRTSKQVSRNLGPLWQPGVYNNTNTSCFRDAEVTIKIIFERSSQKGPRQGVRNEGQQGTHLEFLLSA